jgi:DNA-binding MarR family transcriptional regulator/N-acetylglutamate synthase-like GNAT family acetyltransferase
MSQLAAQAAALRRFNRLWTREIGVLGEHLPGGRFTLAEARVLYEIGHTHYAVASEIGRTLGLDPGYLSRILENLSAQGFIRRSASRTDRRRRLLALTARGRNALAPLERHARIEATALLKRLPGKARIDLLDAMAKIERALDPQQATRRLRLRTHKPGDIGWIVMRHGAVYSAEYGYGAGFEALVAEIGAQFLRQYDASRERCWIAELDGVPAGSVCLVKAEDKAAKLRLLLVEPWARDSGAGFALIAECVRFARQAGYKKIVLWTQSELLAARKLYVRFGFRLAGKKRHKDFGKSLTGENWSLDL